MAICDFITSGAVPFVLDDAVVDLQPLAGGAAVKGIIGEGHAIGVDTEWRDLKLGIAFEIGCLPTIEIGETEIPFRNWARNCPRYVQRSPELMDSIKEMIAIARAWQPHQFNV